MDLGTTISIEKGKHMKKVKLGSAIIALLALGLVACGGNGGNAKTSSRPKGNSSSVSSQAGNNTSSQASSGSDGTTVLQRNFDAGTSATNSDGKEYFTLIDAAANKVGVKISINNFTLDAPNTTATGFDSSGKINPKNDHNAFLRYRITAPKAGDYQMIMRGSSPTNTEKTLAERHFAVKLNNESVDVQDSRAPFKTTHADFVAAPIIHLTGGEDAIDVSAPDYRVAFDLDASTGFIVFAEI